MAFSFPTPGLADKARPRGQGCLSCVHKQYCPSMYWMRRYSIEGRTIDDHNGIQCDAWSNNREDMISTPATDDDLDENDYMAIHGIQSEPDRCGLSTGSDG